jgi:hypothetical protein
MDGGIARPFVCADSDNPVFTGLGKVIFAIAASDCAFALFAVDSACSRNPTSHPATNLAELAFGHTSSLDLKTGRRALKEADNEICYFLARASGSIRERL